MRRHLLTVEFRRRIACGLAVLALAALPAPPAHAENWQNLSPAERRVLAPYRRNWDRYPLEQQERLRDGARRYLELSPRERAGVREQRRRYRALPPEQQRSLREEYRHQRR